VKGVYGKSGIAELQRSRRMIDVIKRSGDMVKFHIREARELFEKSPRAALDYLDEQIEAHLESKDQNSARRLLAEADSMLRGSHEPGLIYYDLRMGVHHYKLGQTGEAISIFKRVIQEAEKRKDDAVWTAAAMTFKKLNEFTEAIWCADKVEEKQAKYSVFMYMAVSLIERGSKLEARSILLDHCAVIARSYLNDNRWQKEHKIEQLTTIAEKLIAIKANKDASAIVEEIIALLPAHWPSMAPIQIEKREAIALLLVKIGQRTRAIELMTAGWLNDDHMRNLRPDEVPAAKMQIIDSHWEKLSRALKA
jgi:hypothetical protein